MARYFWGIERPHAEGGMSGLIKQFGAWANREGTSPYRGNKMSKKTISIGVVIGIGILQMSLFPGCNVKRGGTEVGMPSSEPGPPPKGGPPPWAPAHGYRAKYRYRYYPSFHVYFDVGRRVYFYLDAGRWQMSARLPRAIRLGPADYVVIELETDKPYQYFSKHKKQYPPGQAKKAKKNKRHKWK